MDNGETSKKRVLRIRNQKTNLISKTNEVISQVKKIKDEEGANFYQKLNDVPELILSASAESGIRDSPGTTPGPPDVNISGAITANTTGTENTALGSLALFGGNGGQNVAIGFSAMRLNVSGEANVAVGNGVLLNNTTGDANVGIGARALRYNSTGQGNTAVGVEALENAAFSVSSGDYNTCLGFQAGNTITTGSNNTCLGNGAQPSSITVSDEITLGNSSIATLRCQVITITSLSDARDKKDIVELDAGLDFVEQLKPVSFTWNMRDGGKVDISDTGFIAQDLKQVQIDTGINIPGLVYEANPERMEASYGKLLPVLVKAIQDLKKELDELKAQMK